MLHQLMGELGADPSVTLMIGDTEYDLEMATNAGVSSLGVGYGVHEPHRLARHRPLACLDAITDLLPWLDALKTGRRTEALG
jgi:phosphoglycolate phosphatase